MTTRATVPGFSEKRELIYAARPDAAALSAAGERLLASGLLEDAIEFFTKAGDQGALARVAATAGGAGDVFACESALRAAGTAPKHAEWEAIGETALAAGLLWFAYRAFEKADHQEGLERTRQAMHAAGIAPPSQGA